MDGVHHIKTLHKTAKDQEPTDTQQHNIDNLSDHFIRYVMKITGDSEGHNYNQLHGDRTDQKDL